MNQTEARRSAQVQGCQLLFSHKELHLTLKRIFGHFEASRRFRCGGHRPAPAVAAEHLQQGFKAGSIRKKPALQEPLSILKTKLNRILVHTRDQDSVRKFDFVSHQRVGFFTPWHEQNRGQNQLNNQDSSQDRGRPIRCNNHCAASSFSQPEYTRARRLRDQ